VDRAMLDAADGSGADELLKATHYHATYVKPGWASRLERTGRIGRHVFYFEDMAKTRGIATVKQDAEPNEKTPSPATADTADRAAPEKAPDHSGATELADATQ